MNAREFFDTVAEMRRLQKCHSKTGDRGILQECKAIERAIDAEIKRVQGVLERMSNPKTLFDETSG